MTIAQRIGQLHAKAESNILANEFVWYALHLAAARGDLLHALQIARGRETLPRLQATLKAAVEAGSTSHSTWAAPLAELQGMTAAFLDSLASFGAFDQLRPAMKAVPLRTRAAVVTVAITGNVIGQQQVHPISSLQLESKQLSEHKAAALVVVSNELAKKMDTASAALFGREMRNAVAVATDAQFIDIITSGVGSISSSGGDAISVGQDFAAALATMGTDAASALYVVTSSTIAKQWATKITNTGARAFPDMTPQGGVMFGMPTIVTDGVDASSVVILDANQIGAGAGEIEVAVSGHGALQFETVPDSPVGGTTVLTPLFQRGMTALKADRFFGAERLRAAAVSVISSASWTGNSPN